MDFFEARKSNLEIYRKALQEIKESCDKEGKPLASVVQDKIASTYAATIIIRDILIAGLWQNEKEQRDGEAEEGDERDG